MTTMYDTKKGRGNDALYSYLLPACARLKRAYPETLYIYAYRENRVGYRKLAHCLRMGLQLSFGCIDDALIMSWNSRICKTETVMPLISR